MDKNVLLTMAKQNDTINILWELACQLRSELYFLMP